mmetsp:Transcript_101013/g.170835  ORF Transcript_101013/g.170835 Transcript_101013/m.170835 type:complete len:239 (-) Transcript_101013:904-1620(-)
MPPIAELSNCLPKPTKKSLDLAASRHRHKSFRTGAGDHLCTLTDRRELQCGRILLAFKSPTYHATGSCVLLRITHARAHAHTHTHTHAGNHENKSESTREAVGENSSEAAGQPWTSFGLSKLDGVQSSAGVQERSTTPSCPPQTEQILGGRPVFCYEIHTHKRACAHTLEAPNINSHIKPSSPSPTPPPSAFPIFKPALLVTAPCRRAAPLPCRRAALLFPSLSPALQPLLWLLASPQ